MKTKAVRYREKLKYIQLRYLSGEINRTQAIHEANPVLKIINDDIIRTTEKLNRKYKVHRKPPVLTFTAAMRNEY